MKRRRLGFLLAAAALAAGLTGCGSSAPSVNRQSPSASGSSPVSAGVRQGPAQESPAELAAVRGALMVLDDYERSGTAVKLAKDKSPDAGGVSQYFADQGAADRFQLAAGVGAPLGCGTAAGKNVVDGVVIGTPVVSQNAISVPASLYIGTKQAAQLTLSADPATGKLKDFSCAAAPTAPTMPGVQTLVAYYGGYVAAGEDTAAVDRLKQQYLAPAFAAWDFAGVHVDKDTCAEDDVTYWHAVYAPSLTGAQWYFWPGGTDAQVTMSVAVDPAANHVAWVFCFGQLSSQLQPAPYSDEQIKIYLGDLLTGYAYLLALQPLGADPAVIKPYFATPAAYQAATAATGPHPLECSRTTPAASINPDAVQVTGATATTTLTASATDQPVAAGETALGHLVVVLDLTTMKITSVTCG